MGRVNALGRLLLSLAVTVVVGGFLTGALVRLSPGFGVNEHELDATRDVAALRAMEAARPEQSSFLRYSIGHTVAMFHGDLGTSRNWNRPVAGLLRERWPVTAGLMGAGLLGGWALALGFALPGAVWPGRIWKAMAAVVSGVLLCVPSAALALLIFVYAGPLRAVMALAVFPRVYQYLQNVLSQAAGQAHVMAARARGVGRLRIVLWHILPVAAPQALAGVQRRLLTAGQNKGFMDPFSPTTPEMTGFVQSMLNDIHQQFIAAVTQGRGDRLKKNDLTFSGLAWTGNQAKDLGLVDGLGSADYVAREIIGAQTLIDYTAKPNFFERLSQQMGASIARAFRNEVYSQQMM